MPRADFCDAVPRDQVARQRVDHGVPVVEVVGRHGQALVPAVVAERVGALWLLRAAAAAHQLGQCERELHDRLHLQRHEVVEDLVDVVELVAITSTRRHAHIVVEEAVAADALEPKLRIRQLEVRPPVGARSEQHVARADAPLPVVREGLQRCGQVDTGGHHPGASGTAHGGEGERGAQHYCEGRSAGDVCLRACAVGNVLACGRFFVCSLCMDRSWALAVTEDTGWEIDFAVELRARPRGR